jgi:hypothetical protein
MSTVAHTGIDVRRAIRGFKIDLLGADTVTTQSRIVLKSLDGRVNRKIVKQTVMTNVYGVTFLGATRQVKRQRWAQSPSQYWISWAPLNMDPRAPKIFVEM